MVVGRDVAHRDVAPLGAELAGELAAHPRAAARDDGEPCLRTCPSSSPLRSWIRSLDAAAKWRQAGRSSARYGGPIAGLDKVVVVGAGSVGSGRRLRRHDRPRRRRDRPLRHRRARVERRGRSTSATACSSSAAASVTGGADIAVSAGADLIVVTAGAKQGGPGRPGSTSPAPTSVSSAASCRRCSRSRPTPSCLLVTNPVDVVTYVAQELTGLPARPRARQRHGARHVPPAPPAGRAARRRASTACTPRSSASTATARSSCGPRRRSAARRSSTSSVPTASASRPTSSTACSTRSATPPTGSSRARAPPTWPSDWRRRGSCAAIARDEHAVLPVSARAEVADVGEVCLSVPSVVGRDGVLSRLARADDRRRGRWPARQRGGDQEA